MSSVKVAVRVRPFNKREIGTGFKSFDSHCRIYRWEFNFFKILNSIWNQGKDNGAEKIIDMADNTTNIKNPRCPDDIKECLKSTLVKKDYFP